jgi:LSD1 subclass zinc finger protein
MGGYFSGRWGSIPTRRTTNEGLSLDISALKKCLMGGEWSLHWQWKRGNEDAAKVGLLVSRERVVFLYTVTRGGRESETVRDEVSLTWTGCNYGGGRAWYVCPSCGVRRRVLYLPPGATRFRCRGCHKLAYGTQQMDMHDRHLYRIRVLQKRLDGGAGEYSPFRIPPKPTGMRWATYYRIHDQILMHEIERNKWLAARFSAMTARFDRLNLPC